MNVICVDAREKNQLPSTYLKHDTMQKDGNYYCNVEFESMDESTIHIAVFCEHFTKCQTQFHKIIKT